ncbi:hypothetical protein SSS_04695 [Sarcoptes scabiei]|nr:hypothetical protein SSS_04695 [Sarcoptes scabiei]
MNISSISIKSNSKSNRYSKFNNTFLDQNITNDSSLVETISENEIDKSTIQSNLANGFNGNLRMNNPGLVTFIQINPQQFFQQNTNDNGRNGRFPFLINPRTTVLNQSKVMATNIIPQPNHPATTQLIQSNQSIKSNLSNLNQFRFNQRQLTKGTAINISNGGNCLIANNRNETRNPSANLDTIQLNYNQIGNNWEINPLYQNSFCEKNSDCSISHNFAPQSELTFSLIKLPSNFTSINTNPMISSSNNQPVIYDFVNPNFNHSNGLNWRGISPLRPNSLQPFNSFLQQQRLISMPRCPHLYPTNQTQTPIDVRIQSKCRLPILSSFTDNHFEMNRINLNPNASDFVPSQQSLECKINRMQSDRKIMSETFELSSTINESRMDSPEQSRRSTFFDEQILQQQLMNDIVTKIVDEEEDFEKSTPLVDDPFNDLFDIKPNEQRIRSTEEDGSNQTIDSHESLNSENTESTSNLSPKVMKRNRSSSCATTGQSKFQSKSFRLWVSGDLFATVPMTRSRSNTNASATSDCNMKRFIKLNRYKTELCIYMQEMGKCRFGEGCCFAHGTEEMRSKPPHDDKERTEPCESYSNGICYRGSSRCWYLHPKPEFNLERLICDLKHWLLQSSDRKLFNDDDWFEDDYDPILYDRNKYRSRLKSWLAEDLSQTDHSDGSLINFMGQNLMNISIHSMEHFIRNIEIFSKRFKSLSPLEELLNFEKI